MKTKWELFMDISFYHMWAVRPIRDKDFNSPRLFHFTFKRDAEKFKTLAEEALTAEKCDE